jgi:hypothetical protein
MKILNIFIQIFFIRLRKTEIKEVTDYKLISYDLMPDGNMSKRGHGKVITKYRYVLQFMLPFTNYRLGKKEIKLTKWTKK